MKNVNIYLVILFIFISVAAKAGEIGEIDIHGFISQGYLKSDHNNFLADTEDGTFEFNEMGINFSTWITSKLSIGMQLFAGDLGEVGNDEVKLDWAVADYRVTEWLGLRVGKVRLQGGLYNETRDIDMIRTSVLLPQSVYLDTFREPQVAMKGVGSYGDIDLGGAGVVSFQIVIGTQEIGTDSGIAISVEDGLADKDMYIEIDEFDVDDKFSSSLQWAPLEVLRLRVTYNSVDIISTAHFTAPWITSFGGPPVTAAMAGDVSTTDIEIDSIVYSIEYTWGDMIVAFEYLEQENGQESIIWTSALGPSIIPYASPKRDTTSSGYYGSISYRFTDGFELGVYYSEMYGNKDDKDGDRFDTAAEGYEDYRAWNKDFCLSTCFDININWLIKLEGHKIDGVAGLHAVDHPGARGSRFEEDWYLYAAKVSYMF